MGLCLAAALVGFQACTDSYDLDEEGNTPSWLGQSIYAELQNPSSSKLKGTFSNYLRLVDDLGYAETLSKTGSKTVFAANDSAFARFFASNSWGVKRYEDLSDAQKKMLLYASMLDNALLVEMLSNVEGNDGVSRGMALKHQTSANVTDTITHLYGPADMPVNNSYWASHFANGIDVVMDNTRPMMVHFTNEQMVNNNITTGGSESDFEIITGQPYQEGLAFVFKNGIMAGGNDVTCLNGYINQMQDVVVPPGNLAELLRSSDDTKYFVRMLDRFCAPFYDATTTNNYNDLAQLNGWEKKDSIFAWRYFSNRSQGTNELTVDPNGTTISTDEVLTFDPGWNQYYSNYGTSLADIGAMFVPTDEAMVKYFVGDANTTGGGADIIKQYTSLENTEANLASNLDSLPKNVVVKFVNNLMNTSFVSTVPSKFGTIMDEASDPLGLEISDLHKTADGTYDVRIANNGVAYILDRVIPPISYNIVSTPALIEPNFSVINWAIQDKNTLNLTFYAYLQASTANYALFLPTNDAFDKFYVDPGSLISSVSGTSRARALHFYVTERNNRKTMNCSAWNYNPETGEVGDSISELTLTNVTTQLADILNYHTVVLEQGETFGTNHYYKTKHGGTVYVDNAAKGGHAMSGSQIDNGLVKPTITDVRDYSKTNGMTYIIDRIIQAPQNSVYATLKNASDNRFSEFMNLCEESSSDDVAEMIEWAWGSSASTNAKNRLTVFSSKDGSNVTLDYFVTFFNTYNYTVYAPNNEAMAEAYGKGLPTWDEVKAVKAQYEGTNSENTGKEQVQSMINEINRFIRYHMQDNSIYADNVIEEGEYQTSCTYGANNTYQKLKVTGGGGKLTVTDNYGNSQTIDANGTLMVNKMARDYKFGGTTSNRTIETSSFAAVHEISHPLNYRKSTDSYDYKRED